VQIPKLLADGLTADDLVSYAFGKTGTHSAFCSQQLQWMTLSSVTRLCTLSQTNDRIVACLQSYHMLFMTEYMLKHVLVDPTQSRFVLIYDLLDGKLMDLTPQVTTCWPPLYLEGLPCSRRGVTSLTLPRRLRTTFA
jgi:hypothetical protein